MRSLGLCAVIDSAQDLAAFRRLDVHQVIKLERSNTGHQLPPSLRICSLRLSGPNSQCQVGKSICRDICREKGGLGRCNVDQIASETLKNTQ